MSTCCERPLLNIRTEHNWAELVTQKSRTFFQVCACRPETTSAPSRAPAGELKLASLLAQRLAPQSALQINSSNLPPRLCGNRWLDCENRSLNG